MDMPNDDSWTALKSLRRALINGSLKIMKQDNIEPFILTLRKGNQTEEASSERDS